MTDEVIAPEIEAPVTEQNVTTPEAETVAAPDESTIQADTPPPEEKKFSQSELDEIIKKRIAKADAIAERRALKVYAERLEKMTQPAQPQPTPANDRPLLNQYQNVEDYVEAVADWKNAQRDEVANRNKADEYGRTTLDKTERMYAEAQTLDQSFDRDAFDALPITPPIAMAIIESDMSAKLMVHLSSNPEEAERISLLTPARQAAEIGKLEVTLSAARPVVKVSNAPAPIEPIGSRGASSKSPSQMTDGEFAKWRKAQIAQRGR